MYPANQCPATRCVSTDLYRSRARRGPPGRLTRPYRCRCSDGAGDLAGSSGIGVSGFAVEQLVQTQSLSISRYSHWRKAIDQFEDAERDNEGIGTRDNHSKYLDPKLMPVAGYQPFDAIDGGYREDTSENRAQSPTDSMYSPDIQSIVPFTTHSKLHTGI